jgi:hypothetical protein
VLPDVSPADPAFDPLTAPLPSELARAAETPTSEVPPGDWDATPRRRPEPTRGRRVRPAIRRVKRTVKHIDPMSVLKLSLFFYGCLVIVWMLLAAIAYWFVDSLGFFDALDDFKRDLAIWEGLEIDLMLVEKWAFLSGVTMAVVGAIVNAFLAFLYNAGSDLIGGVDVTFLERDL